MKVDNLLAMQSSRDSKGTLLYKSLAAHRWRPNFSNGRVHAMNSMCSFVFVRWPRIPAFVHHRKNGDRLQYLEVLARASSATIFGYTAELIKAR
jgi:hypothetical protein